MLEKIEYESQLFYKIFRGPRETSTRVVRANCLTTGKPLS